MDWLQGLDLKSGADAVTTIVSDSSPDPRSDWEKSLEILGRTDPHAWRYRQLCTEDGDSRDGYRRLVVSLATGQPIEPAATARTRPTAPTAADRQLQAYVARHGCGGCGR